jgi:hypothetical protein
MLSLIALVVTIAVAYMGAVLGVYRSAMALVSLVIAGVAGFGLMGPLSGLVGSADPQSAWYYAGDAFFLWAITTAVFLALRTAGEKYLPNQPGFPNLVDRAGGAILGLCTAYLAVGLCLILAQMLPTSPELLGYEAFQFTNAKPAIETEKLNDTLHTVRPQGAGTPDMVEVTKDPLWLGWDRGTLTFFDYLSSWPMAAILADKASIFDRYGDVFPPDRPDRRPDGYKSVLNADDFLYYHWYRRYEYIQWRTNLATGPVAGKGLAVSGDTGFPLSSTSLNRFQGLEVKIVGFARIDNLPELPEMKAPAGEDYMVVKIRFRPESVADGKKVEVDTDQFDIVEARGEKFVRPRIWVKADKDGKGPARDSTFKAADFAARNTVVAGGNCLMDGAKMTFTEPGQTETLTLIFSGITKRMPLLDLRLNVESSTAEAARWSSQEKPAPTSTKGVTTPAKTATVPAKTATTPAKTVTAPAKAATTPAKTATAK